MRLPLIAIGTLLCGVAATAAAQVAPGDVSLSNCAAQGNLKLIKGRRLVVNCDSVFVYTAVGHQTLTARAGGLVAENANAKQRYDSLVTTLKALLTLADSISVSKSEIIAHADSIRRIDSVAYDSLSRLTHVVDSLARRSVANTDTALRYINRVQAASYVATIGVGTIVGGLGFKEPDQTFSWGGAVGGALIGLVVNLLIQRFVR